MRLVKGLVLSVAVWLMTLGTVHAQTSCVGNYTNACIGATVCFNATSTSLQTLPQNIQRKYLLIQNESTAAGVFYAICSTPTCTAVINSNTIQLPAGGVGSGGNYEISSINSGVPLKVPTGSIAIISNAGPIPVCFTEHNG